MEYLSELEKHLLDQEFNISETELALEECKNIAKTYSIVENSIAVLSDLNSDKSYIYNGQIASEFGLKTTHSCIEIDSIWEEEIYNLIHPDDIKERHILELHFFHLLKKTPIDERSKYHTKSIIRMLNVHGVYVPILHRTFYLKSQSNGSLWFAMCLYNPATKDETNQSFKGLIINTLTGENVLYNHNNHQNILSDREKEVLLLIEQGFLSKEIALKLKISKNTIDRHRQNIMEKLNVCNSFEALKIARSLHLIDDKK